MFDAAQIHEHARLLQAPERRHVVGIVNIDCTNVGWAASGSSSGESGRFDYEGNGLIFAPSWALKDGFISNPWLTGVKGAVASPQIYIFLNSKDSPGLPFSLNAGSNFGDFVAVCCNFNRFYVYVSNIPLNQPKTMPLMVLKGIDLTGLGSSFRTSGAEIAGCYSCGEGSDN
jgi:hypothetical protein